MRFSGGQDEIEQESRKGDGSQLEEFSFTSSLDNTEATVSYNRHPASNFGLHQTGDIDRSLVMSDDAFSAPYLSFASEGYNFAASTRLADLGALRFGSFFGQQDGDEQSNGTSGSVAELAMPFSGWGELSVQLGVVAEKDTVLGSQT